MAVEIKIVVKRFNHDLLIEELASLPYANLNLAGFRQANRYIYEPASAPVLVSSTLNADKSYTKDFAVPGELRIEMSRDLTVQEDADLDTVLAVHDDTEFTAGQRRERQDSTDYDTLTTRYPDIEGMNNPQLRNYIKLIARVLIRERRANTLI